MQIRNWVLAPSKYLSQTEANKLLTAVRRRADSAVKRQKVATRDYFIIHLGLATGLRVMEMAALECGDLLLEDQVPSLLVKKGKGGKKRRVFFNKALKKHCEEYLYWKREEGESIASEKPLLLSTSTGGFMTRRALQKAFKRSAKLAGLPPSYSIHCLRHTYACLLLKASKWNMRLVQKQLGHSRITTTQVYADVMIDEIEQALNKFCL